MLIDDIDFADLYRQQLLQAKRTEKTPDHWDKRAEKMAENCASPTDTYLQQLMEKMDLQGVNSLFDMGCGPGTVSLALAGKIPHICGVDYSPGMLRVAARRATEQRATHVHWVQRAWEEDWSDLPRCDIAVACTRWGSAPMSILSVDRTASRTTAPGNALLRTFAGAWATSAMKSVSVCTAGINSRMPAPLPRPAGTGR